MIDCLGAAGTVHGDFRTANIVHSDGLGYPGDPGGPIGAEDDRLLYERWKNELWSTLYPFLFTVTLDLYLGLVS